MEELRNPSARAVPAGALSLIGLGVLGLLVALQIVPLASLNVPISAVVVAASLWLAYFSASSARISSPAFIFTLISLVLVYAGDVILYLTEGLPNPLLISLGMLAFSAGAFMTGSRWRPVPSAVPSPLRTATLGFTLALLLGLTLAVVVLLFRLGAGNLLGVDFAANHAALAAAAPSYSLSVALFGPMLVAILLVAQACSRESRRLLAVAFVFSALCALLWAKLGQRFPIFYLAIAWVIVITQFQLRWRRTYVTMGILAAVLGASLFAYVGTAKSAAFADISNPIALVWSVVYDRVFYEQSHAVATLMNVIPTDFPYFGGSTLSGQLFRLPLSSGPAPFSLGEWLFPLLNPDIAGNRVQGFAPPTIFGEFYANFGPLWAVVLMFPVGATLGLVDRWLRPLAVVSVRRLAVYALVATVGSIATGSIYGILRLWEYIVGLVILTVVVVWVLERSHPVQSATSQT